MYEASSVSFDLAVRSLNPITHISMFIVAAVRPVVSKVESRAFGPKNELDPVFCSFFSATDTFCFKS